MLKRLITFLVFFLLATFFSLSTWGQNCISTNNNGKTFNLGCGASCTNINLPIPNLKSSEDYVVSEIPYKPFQYVVNGGTEDPSLYFDDKYSNAFNLPFEFCFFGKTYNQVVVGSNGVLSFDVSNAGCDNAFSINPPIPYGGTKQCDFEALYYPRAAIFGGFKDIDASLDASPADRKIQWRVQGKAPCRVFIVSYYKVGSFRAPCSKTSPNTFQIVLHEATGVIDVFFENKTCNSLTNSSKSILGIQDWDRTKAVAAPGKNAEAWKATQEGYRFTPSGTQSMLVSTEILDAGKKLLATGTTSEGAAGLLNASFRSVCPGPTATYSLLRTTYKACATGQNIVMEDTLYYNRAATMKVNATDLKNTECNYKTGSVTINVPTGIGTAPYQYSINNGAYKSSNVFKNLDMGTHLVKVKDATGCEGSLNVNIKKDTTLTGNFIPYDALCLGVNDGKIVITPKSGTAPYLYGFDGKGTSPDSTINNLLPGSYIPTFVDANECIGTDTVIIRPKTAINFKDSIVGTSCLNFDDGQVFMKGERGTEPYIYRINGGPSNSTGEFLNLKGDTAYSFTTMDKRGCLANKSITLKRGPGIPLTPRIVNTACKGVDNGIIELNPTPGTYTFSIKEVDQPRFTSQSTSLFSNLAPGSYVVRAIPEGSGCIGIDTLNVLQGEKEQFITTFKDLVSTSCKAASDGSATIEVKGGKAPFKYSVDGLTYTDDAVLKGIPSGAILVNVIDALGCKDTVSVNIPTGAGLNMTSINRDATCDIAKDGIIMLNLENGKAPFTYTMDNGLVQRNNPVFKSLEKGNYSFSVVDANGCTTSYSTKIDAGTGITATASITDTARCITNESGIMFIQARNGNDPYYFSLDSFATQTTDSIIGKITSGKHTISIKDSAGCTAEVQASMPSKNIFITADISSTSPFCIGSPTGTITVTPKNGFGNYTYQVNNKEPVSTNVLTGLKEGNYKIRVEDRYGCFAVYDTAIRVTNPLTIKMNAINASCPEVRDGRISLGASGGQAPYLFVYKADTISQTSLNNLPFGNHNVKVIDANGCLDQGTITVNANEKLETRARSTPSCLFPPNGTLLVEPANGNPPFSYAIENMVVDQQKNFFTNLAGGNYQIISTDSKGCKDTITHIVTTREPVDADAGKDQITGVGEPVRLTASGGISYAWDNPSFLSSPNLYTTMATVSQDTKFTVQVTTEYGCIGRDDVMVRIVGGPELYVPTAFSPNGDGLNDIFKPISAGMAKEIYFRVFNRFGELVYETSDFTKGWDGLYRGKQQPIGTYVWNVRATDRYGRQHEKKGYVVLIR